MVLLPPTAPISESEGRLDDLVHYICARVDDPSKLGATKLNKILWYSDVYSFIERGHAITNVVYHKQKHGPVPKGIMASRHRLTQRGAIIEREAPFYGYAQTQFIALVKPSLGRFSGDDIAIVDGVGDAIINEYSASAISHISHDAVWKCAEIGQEIPLYAVLGVNLEMPNQEDLEWAHESFGSRARFESSLKSLGQPSI